MCCTLEDEFFSESILKAAHTVWRDDSSFDPSFETIRERAMVGVDLMQADAILEDFHLLTEVSRIWDNNEVMTGASVPASFHERSVRETEIQSMFRPNADVEDRIRPVDGPRLAAVHEMASTSEVLLDGYFPDRIFRPTEDGAFFYLPECVLECVLVRKDGGSKTCLRPHMVQDSCRIYKISGFDVDGNPVSGTPQMGIFPGMSGVLEFDEMPSALEIDAAEMTFGSPFSLELRKESDYMLTADVGVFAKSPIGLRDDWEILYVDSAETYRAAVRRKGGGRSLLVVESELQEENRYRIQLCFSDGVVRREYVEFNRDGTAELELFGELPVAVRLY
jgi:hypothetical protein